MMNVVETKKTIQDLYSKSQSVSDDFDKKSTSIQLIQPFFEALGWDFQTDVKNLIDDTIADKAFQIDGVTRFYLKVLPHGTSIESSRKLIESLTSLAYNKGVTWAVATNFKEMRVYNTEAPGSTLASMQHYSFNESNYVEKFDDYLSDLTKHQFSVNVLDADAEYFGKKPKRVPIDKQLLKDLLLFRNLLVTNIIKNNSIKEEDAEQATQKILNRLIFIRSCGDRKIEERYLKASVSDWENDKSKKLIEYLREIFAYFNGRYGSTLFEKHSCDSLIIHDGVLEDVINGLYKSKEKAIEYNFAHIEHDSLGKMYENYLGTVQQKKDGAYYTPSYISKYICENTIIPYLSKSDVTTIPDLISEYENNLEELESKIHDIQILDPACGTGEFLIRAVDVLLKISKEIQRKKELQGKYQTAEFSSRKATRSLKKQKSPSATLQTFDMDIENEQLRTIIQNNIHGVDINEEAIEIAQLNIFLKLATSSQQLLDLSKNFRVGNSLIDDPSVDSMAFDWEKEFPEKFDVIIGNPPYFNLHKVKNESYKKFLSVSFSEIYNGEADILYFFFQRGLQLLKKNGFFGFITSRYFFEAKFANKLRNFLIVNSQLKKIIDFGSKIRIFPEAATNTSITIISNNLSNDKNLVQIAKVKNWEKSNKELLKFIDTNFENEINDTLIQIHTIIQKTFINKKWTFDNSIVESIKNKINNNSKYLGKFDGNDGVCHIFKSIESGLDKSKSIQKGSGVFRVTPEIIQENNIEKKILKPLIKNGMIRRYKINFKNEYLLFLDGSQDINSLPNTKNFLSKFKNELESRYDIKNNSDWWKLSNLRNLSSLISKNDKLFVPMVSPENRFVFINSDDFICTADVYVLIIKNKDFNLRYVQGILNSKLMNFFVKENSKAVDGMATTELGEKKRRYSYSVTNIENIPIKITSSTIQNDISKNVIDIEKLYLEINEDQLFLSTDEDLKNQISQIDSKINYLVYQLYGITDEEKAIIESSI